MAAVVNPDKYNIVPFDANYALSGGVIFALAKKENPSDPDEYYVVSEFQRSNQNSRRYPYQGKIEDSTYLFTEEGVTATGMFTLYCADGTNDSEGGGSSSGGGGGGDADLPSLSAKDKVALEALNAMIQLTPNPLAYKNSTTRLLVQKAFEFSKEFAYQAAGGGGSEGGGDEGERTVIPTYSLNDLAGVKKIVWCTEYPATGEEGTVYIKLRTVNDNSQGGA
ncbi:MAG: hypothetical protein II661_06585 [Bacteroidales bacterium]|nr:hypothetical protein [Bacteroidales bacterium]